MRIITLTQPNKRGGLNKQGLEEAGGGVVKFENFRISGGWNKCGGASIRVIKVSVYSYNSG